MASVVCPHCSTKIRLTRKKKSSSTEQSGGDSPTKDESQKNPPRLSIPGLTDEEAKLLDSIEAETESEDVPVIKTRRTRPKVSFDGLESDDPDDSDDSEISDQEAADSDAPEEEEDDDFPKIATRRTRKRVNLDNLALDDLDPEPPNLAVPQSPVVSEPEEVPVEIKPRRKRKPPKTKPKAKPKPTAKPKLDLPQQVDPPAPPAKPKAKVQPPTPPDLVPKRRSLNVPAPTFDSTLDVKSKNQPKPKPKAQPEPEARPEPTPTAPEPTPTTPEPTPTAADPIEAPEAIVAEPKFQSLVEDENTSTDQAEPETVESDSDSSPVAIGPEEEVEPADHLLPPKFLVADIEADQNAVVLPSAGGGFQVVDKTAVRVMHEGRTVELVSLSPDELKRVRLIENLVALLIAAVMLAIAVWLVL